MFFCLSPRFFVCAQRYQPRQTPGPGQDRHCVIDVRVCPNDVPMVVGLSHAALQSLGAEMPTEEIPREFICFGCEESVFVVTMPDVLRG